MSDPENFNEYQQVRHDKLAALRAEGIEPYPRRSTRSHTSQEAIAALERSPDEGEAARVTVAGRVVALRKMGKSAFLHVEDGAGRIQLYLRRDRIGEETYDLFKKMVDLGDIIEAGGGMFRTRTGEATVQVDGWRMMAKAINQPPDKYHGLTDIEQRYRERYVDLLANEEVRNRFVTRSRITSLVRRYLEEQGYIEVETPILQPIYGGAAARPFVTHHNWAGRDFYLRIADELYLKRLIVGGLERVFEIGKDFRNEGISFKHSPEFTMLEAYAAYGDYESMMELVQGCWRRVAVQILGGPRFSYGEHEIDLSIPWQRITMRDAIRERSGVDILECDTLDVLQTATAAYAIEPQPTWGRQVDEIFSTLVEPHLIQPTFITEYPYELSPFAKRLPDDPRLVERFELFMGGVECANAFTELNDPLEQAQRFREQRAAAAQGDQEAHPIDEDYVNALMYGMPPTGGIGWGMDRMVMILTDQPNIREVILFPHLRDSADDGEKST